MADKLAGPRRGLLFILSSPSGAGKTSIARRLLGRDPELEFSVSATTRAPRPGEVDGREYHFVTREAFKARIAAGEMLEHAEVFGNFYGTPRVPVEAAIAAGRDVLFDVDWQGGQQIKNSPLQDAAISVFILPPSIATLEMRLRARAQDSDDVIAGRMAKSLAEISHWGDYDYVLINEDLDACAADVARILAAERLRRQRRPGMVEFVKRLAEEYEDKWI